MSEAASSFDPFAVLGFTRSFSIDQDLLQARYFELSRAQHPDRFSAQGALAQKSATVRMGLINDAYRVLRDPVARREALLRLEAVSEPSSSSPFASEMAFEIAEQWFEVQELHFGGDTTALARFEIELEARMGNERSELRALEKQYDATQNRSLLAQIAAHCSRENYLISLRRDMDRIKTQGGSR